jgi:hypothetical protein
LSTTTFLLGGDQRCRISENRTPVVVLATIIEEEGHVLLLDRPSSRWWFTRVVLSSVLKALATVLSARRERRAGISLPPVTSDWLREHECESLRRGAE